MAYKSVLSNGNGNTRRPSNSRKFLKDIAMKSQSSRISNSLEREKTLNSHVRRERALHLNSLKSEYDSRNKEESSRNWPTHNSHFYGSQNTECVSRKDTKNSPYIDGWGAPTPHYLNGSGANYSWANFMNDRYGLWSPYAANTKDSFESPPLDEEIINPVIKEVEESDKQSEEQLCYPFLSDRTSTNSLNGKTPAAIVDPIKTKEDFVNDYTQTSSSFYHANDTHVHLPQEVGLPCPPGPPHKIIRRTLSGALRIKSNDRPSVLPTQISKELSPLVLRGALDDVNYRVEQILSQIAAKNAT